MTTTATIDWGVFGPKHKRYIRRALDNRMCVAEGAIRSGKTIDHCIIAASYLEQCPDRIHLASGSSIPNAELNLGDCNGYGLEHLFRGRCRRGKYEGNSALLIQTQTGEKVVIFAGAGKADSYKKILGNSYGLWLATEIDQHYDSDDSRTSFVKVAFGRQIAAKWPFTLWDLNPCSPRHPIYGAYIDEYREHGLAGGYRYEHFTLDDNRTISAARKAEIISQYKPGTVWHARDILGERRVAEGLVYQQFADEPGRYLVKPDKDMLRDVMFSSIGIDFGGSRSKTAFVATAIHANYRRVTVLADHRISGEKGEIDADRLCREFVGFVERLRAGFPGLLIKYCWADSEEQYLINSLRNIARRRGLGFTVSDSKKLKIMSRIAAANTLLNTGRMFIGDGCAFVRGGLENAAWDPAKDDVRLDNFSSDIDILDAFEYSWEAFISQLCPDLKGR